MINKTGGTVDRVNYELDKLDTVTDSAVSMADSADTAVRAVSTAITTPVEKVSGSPPGSATASRTSAARRTSATPRTLRAKAQRQREADLHEDLRVARAHDDGDRAPAARSRGRIRGRGRRPCRSRTVPADPVPEPPDDGHPRRVRARTVERRASRRGAEPGGTTALRSRDAYDGRAPRGLPLLLRVEGPPAPTLGAR